MADDLAIHGRRVTTVSVSVVSPYLVLSLPAWAAEIAGNTVDFVLQIDGPVVRGSEALQIDPETGPHPSFGQMLGKTVGAAVAESDGSLRIVFEDGDVLAVEPFEYEPWRLYGSDGSEVISAAGGGLSRREATRG